MGLLKPKRTLYDDYDDGRLGTSDDRIDTGKIETEATKSSHLQWLSIAMHSVTSVGQNSREIPRFLYGFLLEFIVQFFDKKFLEFFYRFILKRLFSKCFA